jgi:hypothetical protein
MQTVDGVVFFLILRCHFFDYKIQEHTIELLKDSNYFLKLIPNIPKLFKFMEPVDGIK